jgi:hypothetical protein
MLCYKIQVSSSQINGGFFLESASVDDVDQREMFCMYLSSGNLQNTKVCKVSKLLFSLPEELFN